MATRGTIEINFRQAMNQANKIDAIANDLSTLSKSKFGGSLQNLAGAWKGENASLYLSKGSTLQSKMNTTASSLHTAASDIRTAAKRLYDAEMTALSIAESRTY